MADLVRDYEAILIIAPDLNAEALQKVQAQFAELITRSGGRVLESALMGRRKLSFRVAKQTEGQYLQVRVHLPPASLEGVRKAAALMEPILRLMLIQGAGAPVPALRAEGQVPEPPQGG